MDDLILCLYRKKSQHFCHATINKISLRSNTSFVQHVLCTLEVHKYSCCSYSNKLKHIYYIQKLCIHLKDRSRLKTRLYIQVYVCVSLYYVYGIINKNGYGLFWIILKGTNSQKVGGFLLDRMGKKYCAYVFDVQ